MGERATLEVDTNRRSGRATYMMTFRRGSLGLVAIFGLFSMAAASPWFYHGLEGAEFHGEEPNQQWFGDTFVPRVLLDGHDGDRQEYGQRGIRGLHATLQVH